MSSRPGKHENPPNHHHMCVLGRFCIPSLVNAPDRIRMPYLMRDSNHIPSSWEAATDEAARILSEVDPARVGFIGSPNLSTESAYALTKLARVATKSANIDFRGSDFPALIHKELAVEGDLARIRTLDYLKEVDWIISVGGDFVKNHQVVAKIVYGEVREGKENFFLFGLSAAEVDVMRSHYDPAAIIADDEDLHRVMQLLQSGHFNQLEPGIFDPVLHAITSPDDSS